MLSVCKCSLNTKTLRLPQSVHITVRCADSAEHHLAIVGALAKDFQIGSYDVDDIMFVRQRIRWVNKGKADEHIALDQELKVEGTDSGSWHRSAFALRQRMTAFVQSSTFFWRCSTAETRRAVREARAINPERELGRLADNFCDFKTRSIAEPATQALIAYALKRVYAISKKTASCDFDQFRFFSSQLRSCPINRRGKDEKVARGESAEAAKILGASASLHAGTARAKVL